MQSLSEELAENKRTAPLLASIKKKDAQIAELEKENIHLMMVINRHVGRITGVAAMLRKEMSSPALSPVDIMAEVNDLMEGVSRDE